MNQIIYRKSYEEFKNELDTEINKTAEGFVRIGYLLKVARDTDILKDSTYDNVNAFAKARYGLDKTQVSRFIHINDRFSEGGYSDSLEPKYRGLGYAKLTIMLQLPEEINNEISSVFSKAEIQALKEEMDEEKKISDLEVLIEGEKEETAILDNDMCKAIHQLGEDDPELFCKIFEAAGADGWSVDMIKTTMAPNGDKMYSIRIRGVGRMLLSLKDTESQVAIINLRTNEKQQYSWEDILADWKSMLNPQNPAGAEKEWENVYGLMFPQKEEVAPVQQLESKKPESRKQSRVTKAKKPEAPVKPEEIKLHDIEPEIPEPEPVEDMVEEQPDEPISCQRDLEDEIQGQDNVENHAEWMPGPDSTEEMVIEPDGNVIEPEENVIDPHGNVQESINMGGAKEEIAVETETEPDLEEDMAAVEERELKEIIEQKAERIRANISASGDMGVPVLILVWCIKDAETVLKNLIKLKKLKENYEEQE